MSCLECEWKLLDQLKQTYVLRKFVAKCGKYHGCWPYPARKVWLKTRSRKIVAKLCVPSQFQSQSSKIEKILTHITTTALISHCKKVDYPRFETLFRF